MVKADIKEIHETIKTMLRYAMALSESPIPEMYELGHYLADNILTKACLAVAIDKGEEEKTYDIKKSGKRWTHGLPKLYDDLLKNYYPTIPDYDPVVKDFHDDRNVYQHDVDFFDMTMRQPRAKTYVNFVEDIIRIVGIINSGETIQPASLSSSVRAFDYSKQQIKAKELKYQELYDLFKVNNDEDIHIKIEHAIKGIFHELQKILSMKGGISQGIRYLHNSKWDINISSFGVGVHSKELKKGYGLNEQNQDIIILEKFFTILSLLLRKGWNGYKTLIIIYNKQKEIWCELKPRNQ